MSELDYINARISKALSPATAARLAAGDAKRASMHRSAIESLRQPKPRKASVHDYKKLSFKQSKAPFAAPQQAASPHGRLYTDTGAPGWKS
jgi:hypothetical protein